MASTRTGGASRLALAQMITSQILAGSVAGLTWRELQFVCTGVLRFIERNVQNLDAPVTAGARRQNDQSDEAADHG